jgi:hypothetical protein
MAVKLAEAPAGEDVEGTAKERRVRRNALSGGF